MKSLGVCKDATLILLVGLFVLQAIIIVLLISQFEQPSRCNDPMYNPAIITHQDIQ